MPTGRVYGDYPIDSWAKKIQMRDSRPISFNISFPLTDASYFKNKEFEGRREDGFESDSGEYYNILIEAPKNLYNSQEYNSDWDDSMINLLKLAIQEIGDKNYSVNLLINMDREGQIELLEQDNYISENLNNEIFNLLKKLRWSFSEDDKSVKKGMHAYCNIEIRLFSDELKKKLAYLEAAKKSFTSGNTDGLQQTGTGAQADNKIYTAVDEAPEFPGGQQGLMTWIGSNLRYPELAQQNNIQGKVLVQFVVRKDGTVSNPTVVRGVDKDLDKEAIRVVRRMPKFKPGKMKGVPVDTYFTLPLTFKLTGN